MHMLPLKTVRCKWIFSIIYRFILGERIKKLRGGENEMAFGEVVNFIPVRRDMVGNSDEKSYFAVEVSGRSMEREQAALRREDDRMR